MLLYIDTSAWVKLYLEERGSGQVRRAFRDAEAWASAPLAWAELHAALRNRGRRGQLGSEEVDAALDRAAEHWPSFYKVDAELALPHVGAVCARHPLRGADAWHLASALGLAGRVGRVVFLCADRALVEAAAREDLDLLSLLDL